MDDLQRAKVTRRTQRAQATKIWNKAEPLLEGDLDEVKIQHLQVILETYDAKIEQLRKIDETISNQIADEETLGAEIADADDYLMELTEKRYRIQFRIKSSQNAVHSDASTSSSSSQEHNNSFNTVNSSHSSNHRLPKLTLPTFMGNPLKWQTFWDTYKTAIHDNVSLSDVQKFTYLKAQLSGEAANSIEGLPLTESNYEQSIKILEDRFGQPHKIINAHMQALLDPSSPTDSVTNLRRFYDSMENHIRGLEALGKKQDTYGDLLIPIVLAKIPTSIKHNIIRENGTNNWTVEQLRKAILKEIQILEAGEETDVFNQVKKPFNTFPSTASLLTNASQIKSRNFPNTNTGNPAKPRLCVFCSGHHRAHECTVVRDPDARKKIAFQSNLCFNCLNNHRVSQCNSKNHCRKCHKKHHTSLCNEKDNEQTKRPEQKGNSEKTPEEKHAQFNISKQNQPEGQSSTKIDPSSQTKPANTLCTTLSDHYYPGKQTILKTAINSLESPSASATAHILFDEGAQRSFITRELANKLDLSPERSETLNLSVFGGSTTTVKQVDIATVYIRSDSNERIPIQVVIIPTIAAPQNSFLTADIRNLPHLRDLKLAHPVTSDDQFQISLLIGADHYWDIVENDIIRGPGPTAAKSKIGYLLSGPITTPPSTSSTINASILKVIVSTEPENKALERFWNLESIGILPNETEANKTQTVSEYKNSSIRLENDQYCAKLPWKDNHPPLPTNQSIARGRTRSTVRRLSKEPPMLAAYDKIIQEQLQRCFIEKVADPQSTTGRVHYIPHHVVLKDSSTTPLRIVYDCSCSPNATQPSLNSCLSTGPDILNDMTAILVRFRCYQYGITADIEKAFLSISLDEQGRDATRFFWISDPTDPESQFEVYRFKSILFGATCSPFILNATIQKHLDQFNDPVTQRIKSDLYVDNLASGTDNEDEATIFLNQARTTMTPVQFNLRSWNSNSSKVKALATERNIQDTDTETKVFGLRWNARDDVLKLQPQEKTNDNKNLSKTTKRDVLRESAKVYDPLGLLSPITIRTKIFIQQLWERGFKWDEPLPDDIQKQWLDISQDLADSTHIQVQRRYFPLLPTWPSNAVLHIFVDASIKAYGTVAYLTSGPHTAMVMSKSRVAPLKKLTLPQLELMAAVVGARLASYLRNQLKIAHTVYWSDSQIIIHWLSSTKDLKQFVKNRVIEIRESTRNATWNYCPSSDNPADLLTRGVRTDALIASELWNNGPTWLTNQDSWPQWNPKTVLLQTIVPEDPPSDHDDSPPNETSQSTLPSHIAIGNVINLNNYSDLKRILRTTAWLFRFVNVLRKRQTNKSSTLSASEVIHAKNVWIREIQSQSYLHELANLQNKTASRLSLVRQLRLFLLDDNIIRCGGRIHNAPVLFSTKFPVLLPPNNHFTTLVVNDAHERSLHSGLNHTLTHVRQHYWIPQARQFIKKLLRHCVTCRKVNGKPYKAPDPPPLPTIRLVDSHPFTVTGVDFTRALYVKTSTGQEKVYICLFTCANTRAVHLEVVTDLTVPTFVAAFRRFVSRKSLPKVMISDNASTYQSAADELTKLLDSSQLMSELGNRGIEWKFIPKRAPWYGGFWERLIGLTKLSLKKVLGKTNITLDELQTITVEIEAVLNDRPLTYVSSEIDDAEPLTPSHLLYGRRITNLPHPLQEVICDDPTYNSGTSQIEDQAKRRNKLVQHFWNRWRQEYLTSLREFHKVSGKNETEIKVGDVVQVHDDTKRVNWRLAIVERIIKGKDGLVRAADIKTSTGYTNRPITKLYPLEVTSTTHTTTKPECSKPSTPTTSTRPVRKTAQVAKEKLKRWASELSCPPEDVEN